MTIPNVGSGSTLAHIILAKQVASGISVPYPFGAKPTFERALTHQMALFTNHTCDSRKDGGLSIAQTKKFGSI